VRVFIGTENETEGAVDSVGMIAEGTIVGVADGAPEVENAEVEIDRRDESRLVEDPGKDEAGVEEAPLSVPIIEIVAIG